MKCIGKKCNGYCTDYLYPICSEITTLNLTYKLNINTECKLLEKIQEVRDDLIRRCKLFENILEIEGEDGWDDINWSDKLDV